MSLFGKKKCCNCNENIVAVYKKKLPCGLLCEKCNHKLSPFVKSTRFLNQSILKQHMEYREENSRLLEKFQITRIIGEKERLVIDDKNKLFLITANDKWANRQPDVLHFEQVTGFDRFIEAIESVNYSGGSKKAFDDSVNYNFIFTLTVDSPWFDVISLQINKEELYTDDPECREYREYAAILDEVKETFRPYYRSIKKIS